MTEPFEYRVGFVGAGRMATALAIGLTRHLVPSHAIVASDVHESTRQSFEQATGCGTTSHNLDVVDRSDVVFLAVKPQVMSAVLNELQGKVDDRHLVISIAAGISLAQLQSSLGDKCRIVRVMPNTPSLVNCGAAGYALGGSAERGDGPLVEQMLQTVGLAIGVPEHLLDAVTGLSGSGPAYIYQVIEALSDGGVLAGLPRDVATTLAAQTVMGAAQMVLQTGQHPGVLKDAVTSPGGTTITGLHQLEQSGVRSAMMNAVVAAARRSSELGG